MLQLTTAAGILKTIRGSRFHSWSDVLAGIFSAYTFCLFGLILGGKQYFGTPLQCWVDAQFVPAWEQYAESYCFVSELYYRPDLSPTSTSADRQINYYPWVSLFLLGQAAIFYLPTLVFRVLCTKTVINMDSLSDLVSSNSKVTGKERELFLNRVCAGLKQKLRTSSGISPFLALMLMKLCHVPLFQIFATSRLLDSSCLYGLELINAYSTNLFPFANTTNIFPLIVMFHFDVRKTGNTVNEYVQCTLMLNVLYRKLFLVFYVWFIVLSFVCFLDLCFYFLGIIWARRNLRNLIFKTPTKEECKNFNYFCSFIGAHGICILNIIAEQDSVFAGELTASWFVMFENDETLNDVVCSS